MEQTARQALLHPFLHRPHHIGPQLRSDKFRQALKSRELFEATLHHGEIASQANAKAADNLNQKNGQLSRQPNQARLSCTLSCLFPTKKPFNHDL